MRKIKQRHLEALIIAIILIACALVLAVNSTEVKDIKYGRKDLIRNELVNSVINSNNELVKQVILHNGYQVELLNSRIIELERQLTECKAVKNKK